MSILNRQAIDRLANQYWQNDLAKFDPTRTEANGFEINMFRHGVEHVLSLALKVIERIEEDLITGQRIKSSLELAKLALIKEIENNE